ncbi:MAG: hypothetical protein ACLQIB_25785 [Isosphaeraceae bacterium]
MAATIRHDGAPGRHDAGRCELEHDATATLISRGNHPDPATVL